MKLYLIHCGFYDREVCDGICEGHANVFVVADNLNEAKKRVRLDPAFQLKRKHVDGVQEVEVVHGNRITLMLDSLAEGTRRT